MLQVKGADGCCEIAAASRTRDEHVEPCAGRRHARFERGLAGDGPALLTPCHNLPMRLACIIQVALYSATVFAAQHAWRDAKAVNISESEITTESVGYSRSLSNGNYPGVPSNISTQRSTIWTYTFDADGRIYTGRVESKPIRGLKKGDHVRLDVTKNALYVLTGGRKERRLDLLNPQ